MGGVMNIVEFIQPYACPKGNCRGYVRWAELG